MKILSLLAVSALAVCLTACEIDLGIKGNGNVVTVQQQVGPFSEISARGGLRIEWQSGAPSLSITTDDNLVQYFEVHNSGDRLEVRMRERIRPTRGIKLVISSPSLKGARLTGAADFIGHGVTGSSFAVQTTGASNVVLDGKVDQLLVDITGAGKLKAKDLQCNVVEIATTGAADAWVNAAQKLRVAITGAGDITYSGNPPTIEKKIRGAGTIRHKD